jgi:site-specific DNA recombinase
VFKDGGEVTELLWDKGNTVETVCLLSKLHEAKHHVNVRHDMDEMDLTAAERR